MDSWYARASKIDTILSDAWYAIASEIDSTSTDSIHAISYKLIPNFFSFL